MSAETDWKHREQGWRVGGKRADVVRHLFCLFVGHDWQANRRETQRVCRRCWWCHDRITTTGKPTPGEGGEPS